MYSITESEDDESASARELFEKTEEVDRIRVLLAMSLGLERDLSKDERLKAHVDGGRIERSKISLRGKQEYNVEIVRRAQSQVADESKRPRPSAWKNPKRFDWLVDNPVSTAESKWIYTKFDSLMDKFDREAEDDIIPGSTFRVTDRYKMRLYEAYFFEEFRDLFIQRNDSLSRTQLDARNSESEAVKPYHEVVCDKYNDETWVPSTKLFPQFHHELADPFDLELPSHRVLTYEQAKRLLVDVRGRLKMVRIILI